MCINYRFIGKLRLKLANLNKLLYESLTKNDNFKWTLYSTLVRTTFCYLYERSIKVCVAVNVSNKKIKKILCECARGVGVSKKKKNTETSCER